MNHDDLAKEIAAGASTVGSWTLWGITLVQVNQVLQAITFIAATVCSIAAFIYYRKKSK
jgi:hypothetical protein